MKALSFALSACLILSGCGMARAQWTPPAQIISIVDGDFESQPVINGYVINDPAGCGTYEENHIAGWVSHHIPGEGIGVAHWTCDDGMPNSNVAYLSPGSLMYQVTAEKARQGVYVLQFDVANWYYSYPANWNAQLYQATPDPNGNYVDTNGNKWTLSPAPFCSASGWALGDMKRQTATCDMPGYFLQVTSPDPLSVGGQKPGGNIVIFFQNHTDPALGGHAGWITLIDNVSLSFSPQM